MQKNATPNKEQAEIIRRAGLNPVYYTVVRNLNNSMIIRDRRDGSVQIIEKK